MSSKISSRNKDKKRSDYISWEDYFMGAAQLAAMRSKDPCTQVGACIVDADKKIIGLGYNGFPKGCSDDEFSWARRKTSPNDNKHFYVCHAEMNAILNMNSRNAKNCKLYVTLFPCNECAKFIIQSGIKEVFYKNDDKHDKVETQAARRMFDAAGVKYSQFIPKVKVTFDFVGNNSDQESQSPPKIPRREDSINSSN